MSIIGKSSLAIMYLHMMALDALKRFPVISKSKLLCFTIVILGSICFSAIVRSNKYTKVLFCGYRKET